MYVRYNNSEIEKSQAQTAERLSALQCRAQKLLPKAYLWVENADYFLS
jgi:hypothetical protein